MEALTYTDLRTGLASAMDRVCENHVPIVVARQGKDPVILISLEDYNALVETTYLMRSPKNVRRLVVDNNGR